MKCCADCENCLEFPRNNRYGDTDYLCLTTGYYVHGIHKNRDKVKGYTPGGRELTCRFKEKRKKMNKWQKKYCDTYYGGKMPKTKAGKEEFRLLGEMKDYVEVDFPEFYRADGIRPAHTRTYEVTMDECDIPNNKISAAVLAGNLRLWNSRGYQVRTK